MTELILESLAARVVALEHRLAERQTVTPTKDWRKTIGMFAGNEFIQELDAEVVAMREAEREAARCEVVPDEPTIIEIPGQREAI